MKNIQQAFSSIIVTLLFISSTTILASNCGIDVAKTWTGQGTITAEHNGETLQYTFYILESRLNDSMTFKVPDEDASDGWAIETYKIKGINCLGNNGFSLSLGEIEDFDEVTRKVEFKGTIMSPNELHFHREKVSSSIKFTWDFTIHPSN